METILIDNKKYEISKVNRAVKLNAKEKRKFVRINSKEMFHLSRKDREKVKEEIKSTHIWVIETKSNFECKAVIDLTENGIKEAFKNFDDPDFPIVELDNNFYFVRPEEQTKAKRQTEIYQLEQLLDIMIGTKKAQATFIVKTDEDYEGKIYCYDGQHQFLLMIKFLLYGKKFMTKNLQKAFDIKKEHYGSIWKSKCVKGSTWHWIQEFLEVYKKEEFSKDDMIITIPEISKVFSNSDMNLIYTNLHFCDSKSAAMLMKKINEHLSGHSTTQMLKSFLVGTLMSNLLFKTNYKITDKISGRLSKIVPLIPLFNRGDNELSEQLPYNFSYDTSSDDYHNMNYDQYLKVIYSCILSKTQLVTEYDKEGKVTTTNYVFDVKTNPNESYMWASGGFKDGLMKSYGKADDIYDFWKVGLSELVIKNEKQFVEYIEDVIKLCYNLSEEDNVNSIYRFDSKLEKMAKPIREEISNISKLHPNIDTMPDNLVKELDNLKFKKTCIEDFKLKKGFQLLPMMFMILNTRYISKYDIGDWTVGFLNTIVDEFDAIVEGNRKKWIRRGKKATYSRMGFLHEWYDNKSFSNRVSDVIQMQDNSLWSRKDATDDYIKQILFHTDDILYKCPHTGKNVTVNNFVSHHLSFRSKGDAYKVFDFWFPLSPKFNGHISDDRSRNIVKNNEDGSSGNFIDACKSMIDLFNIKIKNSDGVEMVEWTKSKNNLEQWIMYAEMVIN